MEKQKKKTLVWQLCQILVLGSGNYIEIMKTLIHAALFLLKLKDNFVFELF